MRRALAAPLLLSARRDDGRGVAFVHHNFDAGSASTAASTRRSCSARACATSAPCATAIARPRRRCARAAAFARAGTADVVDMEDRAGPRVRRRAHGVDDGAAAAPARARGERVSGAEGV